MTQQLDKGSAVPDGFRDNPELWKRIGAGLKVTGPLHQVADAIIADLQAVAAKPDAVPRGFNAYATILYHLSTLFSAEVSRADADVVLMEAMQILGAKEGETILDLAYRITSDKNWLRAQRDTAEEKLADARVSTERATEAEIAQWLDDGFSIKVLNPEHGNYWSCPHCDMADHDGHEQSCVIRAMAERLAGKVLPFAGATVPTELGDDAPSTPNAEKSSRRQIVFDWFMQEEGYWGGSEEVARVDELLAKLDAATPSHEALKADDQFLRLDEARLLWLDTTFRHCPHAELTYNDDDDGMDGPQGFTLIVQGCTRLELHAPTLDELIDLGMNAEPDEDGNVIARVSARKST